MTTSDGSTDFTLSRSFSSSDHSAILAQALTSTAGDFNIAIRSHLGRTTETSSLKSLFTMDSNTA
jgi:hypothetical protein